MPNDWLKLVLTLAVLIVLVPVVLRVLQFVVECVYRLCCIPRPYIPLFKEWLRFQKRNRKFFSAAAKLRAGMSREDVLSILGEPSDITDPDGGREDWFYDRGRYYALYDHSAFNGRFCGLSIRFDEGKYSNHILTFVFKA